jgi:N-acyl-D-amino-acid deacylase
MSSTLAYAGFLKQKGELDAAETMMDEVRDTAEELGMEPVFAASLLKLGWLARARGDLKRSEKLFREGLRISADMYAYPAGATGLDAAMPPWVQAGGNAAWFARLRDPAVRKRVAAEMRTESEGWENLMLAAGGAENMLIVVLRKPELKQYIGKTLAEIAALRGKSPEETAMDLVAEDETRVGTVYFLMSEDEVRRKVALPWMSFGSDAEASAPEGVFLKSSTHPRAYGNFARFLGHYVRDQKVVSLSDAVRRLS